MFTHAELISLYHDKVKKDTSYFKKYENLDLYKDGKIETMFTGKDFPRIPCILDFREWVKKYDIIPEKMLYTSETDFELNYIRPITRHLIEYDQNTNHGDLHTLSLNDKDYDFCLFSQTIEHLYNPFQAIKKIYEHVRVGGFVFTSVPTINIPHMTPIHFTGYYPMGLAVLFETAGFKVIEMGQWGNLNYINYIFTHHGWPDYEYLKNAGNGVITNEERNVAQCWVLAKKME